jgi:ATP-binding cassette subfamily C (CFTR/MRP) protein 4
MLLGFYAFTTDIVIRLSVPIFLGRLLEYFSPKSNLPKDSAYLNAGMLVFINFCGALTINQFILGSFVNGMKVRLATCSLIYRKALKLSATALGSTSVGKVVNLLSNDVSRFDIVSVFLHSMWLAPLLTIIVGILLYREVGEAGLVGILVIGIVTPIQSFTGKLSSKFRLQTAIRTDERVRLMDEIINGIQVIKLYAWEKSFKKLIQNARIKELKVIKKSSYIRALYMTFMLFTTRSALYCTMMAIVVLGDDLSAAKVFVISSYFQIISSVMSQMFVRGLWFTLFNDRF